MFGKDSKQDDDQEVTGRHKPNDKGRFDDFNKTTQGEVY